LANPKRTGSRPAAAEIVKNRSRPDDQNGVLTRAANAGDYRTFRTALAGYEEWLRKRVGRWIQRYPEAEARIGRGLAIGDVLEAVYLNAFEQFSRRPKAVPFHEWLDELIDPSLKAHLKHPDEERASASFARTVRQMGRVANLPQRPSFVAPEGRGGRPPANFKGERAMKQGLSNAGKKDERQINQLLQKQGKEGRQTLKEVEARTIPKQHSLRGRKGK